MKKFLVLLIALLVGSNLMASNMGFKLNKSLNNSGNYGLNWVALPYFTSLTTASQVCTDIGANANVVSHWVSTPSEGYEDYFCQFGFGADFNLTKGEGILVTVIAPTTWIIVGSHDDAQAVSFNTNGNYGLNWFSVPYHRTPATASALCTSIGANANVISRWVISPSEGYEDYFCQFGFGSDFTLNPGEAVIVTVLAPTSYTPAHY